MSYVQGFLLAVRADQRETYRRHAAAAWPVFQRLGCLSAEENWGVDVQPGEVTSFPQAVKLEEGEVVVFSWMVWPDRATCDAAWARMMSEPELMEGMGEMPFDGRRMMWGGFEPLFSAGA
ncbi:DUF1428 domain-containing protein [Roseicyclus persicicus]|uniref:DUF1428 domain-containing protein n=1 Tax=Roseicyclus persicicus TaxID=2650661 RepID=A0A7X6K0B9_9RHOB|nr:DUF1428 domain-containing protein [Roseibacterium persicicum]NKX46454.1 DUF1428 domain-containing protein [Roseibacterium persicicum]